MIEIIYDEAEQKMSPEMPVKIPKNLRQIGDGNSDVKVYLEDYVMTFIHRFWDRGAPVTTGVLLGEVKRSGKETYIFASGAISVDSCNIIFENGKVQFTDETWGNIYGTIKEFFNKYMIVGWFLNRNESCLEVSEELIKLHLDNFSGSDKVLMLSDTVEKEERLYHYENNEMMQLPIYYVYYERNEDMQEYMVCEKSGRVMGTSETEIKDNVPTSCRSILKEKKEDNSQKRMVGVLYGACTFLAVVILMIGVAMMNNYDKIESLEKLVSDLYKTAMGHVQEEYKNDLSDAPVIDKVDGNIEATSCTKETTEVEDAQTIGSSQEESTDAMTKDNMEINDTETESLQQEQETSKMLENIVDGDNIEDVEVKEGIMYHIVVEGDTLTSISRKFYNTDTMVEVIKELNEIENGNMIYPGQVIRLP